MRIGTGYDVHRLVEGRKMAETLVTVEFLERGRATEVVLKHELFPAD